VIAIFCGSREWTDVEAVRQVMTRFRDGPQDLDTVIHGAQRGADSISGDVAKELGLAVIPEPAEWKAFGHAAGPMRNDKMLAMLLRAARTWNQPVHCVAFHADPLLGVGTRDMVKKCLKERVRVSAYVRPQPTMVRSSGEFVCRTCKLPYRKHPTLISELDSNGEPFLELSCDGLALKL
jgi:hypothetical protein